MTSFDFLAQGSCDLSSGQVVFKFNMPELANQGSFTLLSQQLNNKESQEVVWQKPTFIRKSGLHFCSSALGMMGGVGLIASCLSSILLPAIASVGVIGIAYLIKRKVVPLDAKELFLDAAKSQNIFREKAESSISTDNGSDSFAAHAQLNFSKPEVAKKPTLSQKPDNNSPPPPPLPLETPQKIPEIHTNSRPLEGAKLVDEALLKPEIANNSAAARNSLLQDIRNPKKKLRAVKKKFNMEETEEILRKDPTTYNSVLLLKELKSTYERALKISQANKLKRWEGYFLQKVETFEEKYPIMNQRDQITENLAMETVCKETEHLDSLSENMQWIKSLLSVLSNHSDLSADIQKKCRQKVVYAQKHIKKLISIENTLKKSMGDSLVGRRDAQTSSEDDNSSDDEFIE
ncbi:MAG: hypothetical protein ACRDAI_04595 [Candidatus Rhabdochlamydia sp.]